MHRRNSRFHTIKKILSKSAFHFDIMSPEGAISRVRKLTDKDIDAMPPKEANELLKAVSRELNTEMSIDRIKDANVRKLIDRIGEKVGVLNLRAEHIKALITMGEFPTTKMEITIAESLNREIPLIAEMIALDVREEALRRKEKALLNMKRSS